MSSNAYSQMKQKYMPARTSPGYTRSASPVVQPGLGRKVGYRRKDETTNRGGHIENQYLECANFVERWKTGTTEEGMEPYTCDILGLAEMRWTGCDEMNGCELLWSGAEKEHAKVLVSCLARGPCQH
jgi:hypothetical protein